jgi:hypothetical protein
VQRLFTLDTLLGGSDRRVIDGGNAVEKPNEAIIAPPLEFLFFDNEADALTAYAKHYAAAREAIES